MTILLFYPELEMLFSSHVTLGIYSLIIEFYWAKQLTNADFGKRNFHSFWSSTFFLHGFSVCVCWSLHTSWRGFLSSPPCGSNDRRRTTHTVGFVESPFGNLVFAMDEEGHEALQLHRDKPSFVRCVQSNEQTKETMRWVMYDPDMITASTLGNPWC